MSSSECARGALEDANIKRLMTIPGIGMIVALGLAPTIGQVGRFKGPEQLVAYLGLNPNVHPFSDWPP